MNIYNAGGVYWTNFEQLTLVTNAPRKYPREYIIWAIIIKIIDFFILNLSSNFNASIVAKGKNTNKNNTNSIICGKYDVLYCYNYYCALYLIITFIFCTSLLLIKYL